MFPDPMEEPEVLTTEIFARWKADNLRAERREYEIGRRALAVRTVILGVFFVIALAMRLMSNH